MLTKAVWLKAEDSRLGSSSQQRTEITQGRLLLYSASKAIILNLFTTEMEKTSSAEGLWTVILYQLSHSIQTSLSMTNSWEWVTTLLKRRMGYLVLGALSPKISNRLWWSSRRTRCSSNYISCKTTNKALSLLHKCPTGWPQSTSTWKLLKESRCSWDTLKWERTWNSHCSNLTTNSQTCFATTSQSKF